MFHSRAIGNLQAMRITTLAEYGVICALHLARRADEGPVTGREIADARAAARRLRRADPAAAAPRRASCAAPAARTAATRSRGRRDEISDSRRDRRRRRSRRSICTASRIRSSEERCSASHNCSIRPVWMLLQQKIDDVLEGVHLSDLLHEESEVRDARRACRFCEPIRRARAGPPVGSVPPSRAGRARARSAAARRRAYVARAASRAGRRRRGVARASTARAATSITRDGSCATRAARSASSPRSATRSTIARRRSSRTRSPRRFARDPGHRRRRWSTWRSGSSTRA